MQLQLLISKVLLANSLLCRNTGNTVERRRSFSEKRTSSGDQTKRKTRFTTSSVRNNTEKFSEDKLRKFWS